MLPYARATEYRRIERELREARSYYAFTDRPTPKAITEAQVREAVAEFRKRGGTIRQLPPEVPMHSGWLSRLMDSAKVVE